MTLPAERCPTCDRDGLNCPTLETLVRGTLPNTEVRRIAIEARNDCLAHRVDWRARALAAEAELAGASAAICDVSDTIRRALDGDEGGMRAPYHGPLAVVLRYPSIAADLRRLDEVLTIGSPRAAAMRDAAARWAKVAPLIERLRVPDGRPLYADIMTLLAATEAAP